MYGSPFLYTGTVLNARCSKHYFHRRGLENELPQSKPDGFASSLWEGAFGMVVQFSAKVQSLRERTLPRGELSHSD